MTDLKSLGRGIALVAVVGLGSAVLATAPAFAQGASVGIASAILNQGTDTSAVTDSVIIHPKDADRSMGSQAATIVVTLNDVAGNAIISDKLSATSNGPGVLGTGAGSPSGFLPMDRAISVSVSSVVPGKYVFGVFGDGSGGYSTIEISDGATLLASKIVAFYGPVAKITAQQNFSLPNVNGTPLGSSSAHNPGDGTYAHTPAVVLIAKDANGIPTPSEDGSDFDAVSSDLTVLSPVITVIPDDTLGAGSFGVGTYNVQVRAATGAISGKSATLTFRYKTDNAAYVWSAPVTFTVSSSTISRVMLAFDKNTYQPGESATLTLSAFDPSGTPVAGQDAGNFFANSAGLAASSPIADLLFPFTTLSLKQGTAAVSFSLPIASGSFTVKSRLGNGGALASSIQGTQISTTATILSQQEVELVASNLAASHAETAANAALAAVLSLTSYVKSLAIVVLKIQKKLGIK
jgi:hypothetical protein